MSYYPPGSESTDPRDNDAVTPVTAADHAQGRRMRCQGEDGRGCFIPHGDCHCVRAGHPGIDPEVLPASPTAADHANTARGIVSDYQDVISLPDVDRLLAALDALQAQAEGRIVPAEWLGLTQKLEAAEAERDRLADALKHIRDDLTAVNTDTGRTHTSRYGYAARMLARAALAETERTP